MSGKHHTDQIIGLLLPWLSNPIPTALSKPPRSAIRQVQLAKVARVSKRFRDLVNPLLYGNIVTDNLPRLLEQGNLMVRKKLFKHTKSLRIEYSDKQRLDPTYEELCDRRIKGAWERCGTSKAERMAEKTRDCEREMEGFTRLFGPNIMEATMIDAAAAFPSLRIVAIASIYGNEPNVWDSFVTSKGRENNNNNSPFDICALKFSAFLHNTKVRHLCVRNLCGPLSLPIYRYRKMNVPIITSHFQEIDIPRLPCLFDSPSRWAFEGDCSTDWDVILRGIGQRMKRLNAARAGMMVSPQPLDLDIFCSTSSSSRIDYDTLPSIFGFPTHPNPHHSAYTLSLSEQTDQAAILAVKTRDFLRRDPKGKVVGVNDLVRWSVSADTPICAACGSGAPVSAQSDQPGAISDWAESDW